MRSVFAYLIGRPEYRDKYEEFCLNPHQGQSRLPTFNAPGDRVCAIPAKSNVNEDHGVGYNCHNVDTKFQQLALLSGAIKLANLAREWIGSPQH